MSARTENWKRWARPVSRRAALRTSALGSAGLAAYLAGCSSSNNKNNKVAVTAVSTAATRAATAAPAGSAATSAAATRAATSAAGTAGTAAAQATQAPRRGGSATFTVFSPEPHLDVQQASAAGLISEGAGAAYSRLLHYKLPPEVPSGVTSEVAPDLALSWEQQDPTTVVFKLQPNALFQNIAPVNGRKAVSDDVVYSFKRQIALKTNASFLPDMDSFDAVDPTTVRVKLKQPDADVLAEIGYWTNKVVAKEAVDVHGDLKEGPTIGTGAWILDDVKPGEYAALKRNPTYFLPELPYLDTLRWLRLADVSTQIAAFRSKQLLWYYASTAKKDQVEELKQIKGVQSFYLETRGQYDFQFQVDNKPLDDVRVRKAIVRALNVEGMMQVLFGGTAGTDYYYTLGVVLPSLAWRLSQDDLKAYYKYDPNEAKALLQQAGVSNVRLSAGVLTAAAAVGEYAQGRLKDVGITLDIQQLDSTNFLQSLTGVNKFHLVIGIIGSGPASATADLVGRYGSNGSRNGSHIKDAKLDDLINRQAVELNQDARKALLQDTQRYLVDNVYAMSTGQAQPNLYYDNVQGIKNILQFEYASYDRVWLSA